MTQAKLVARAEALLDLDRPQDAVAMLGGVAAGSGDPELHALLVRALLNAERIAEAGVAAENGIAEVGLHPELARVASYVFAGLGQQARALALARAAADGRPDWVAGLLALAWASAANEQYFAALSAVDAALALAPRVAAVHVAAGEVAVACLRPLRARAHYHAALRLDPTGVTALAGLGEIEERRSRYGQAARWYATALAIRPGDRNLQKLVRGLFGQALMVIAAAIMVLHIVVFVAVLSATTPNGAPTSTAGSIAWSVAAFAGCGVLLWLSLRAAPRVVIDALRSDARPYRQARRALRRTIAQVVLLAVGVLAIVVPAGLGTRLGIFVLVFLAGFVVAIVNLIGMRIAFGYGGRRPASR